MTCDTDDMKRPRDVNQLAKLIVDLATKEVQETTTNTGKNATAVAKGRRGGLRGGAARAAALSPRRRAEIARKAAAARWKSRKKQHDV
jgi:hypothetical protein